jgi:hypothetical protein
MRVDEAAKKLGMSTQTLRLALQQRLFPFGEAVKTSSNRYTYYISPRRLQLYLEGVEYERQVIKSDDMLHRYDTDRV